MLRLLFLTCCCLVGQSWMIGQEFDLKYFDYAGNNRQGLYELAALPNGDMLMYGHHFANINEAERGGIIFSLDQWGDIVGPAEKMEGNLFQIKDAVIRPNGDRVLLGGYQDATTFKSHFGLIFQDDEGIPLKQNGWLGKMEALTDASNGGLLCVGSALGTLGNFAFISSDGAALSQFQILPETVRPAGLLDVVTLRGGDHVAVGTITTSIAGIPQKEIVIIRLAPNGRLIWSKKVSRGKFFSADGMIMELRRPTRIHLDAEENIHLLTYLGSGGGSWRTHLLKLTSEGGLVHSTAFTTEGQYAGQGALHLNSSGSLTLAFETISGNDNHSLTALAVDRNGRAVKAVRKDGLLYDVSSIERVRDGSAYFITGTTIDCVDGDRLTYVARLDAQLFFGTEACGGDEITYESAPVPVEILDHSIEIVSAPIATSVQPILAEAEVRQRAAGCVFFEPFSPAPFVVGCGTVPGIYPLFSDLDMLDGGQNILSVEARIVSGPTGARFRYDGFSSERTVPLGETAFRFGIAEPYERRTWAYYLENLFLVPPVGVDFTGEYLIEFAVEGNCGETILRSTTLSVLRADAPPDLTTGQTVTLCPGEPTVLRAASRVPTAFRWADLSSADTLLVTEPGIYGLSASNACGSDTTTFVVLPPPEYAPEGLDTTLFVCPEGLAEYTITEAALSRVQWKDGTPTAPPRTFRPDQGGTYELEVATACETATHRVKVEPSFAPTPPGDDPTRLLCGSADTVLVTIPTEAGESVIWEDGPAPNPRPFWEAGRYALTVANQCGETEYVLNVKATKGPPLFDDRELVRFCRGDSVTYIPSLPPGVEAFRPEAPELQTHLLKNSETFTLVRTNGCTEATTIVEVIAEDCCRMYLPTAFSPNGDGVNDTYSALPSREGCATISGLSMAVYDRWGGEVFRGSGAWDGSQGGDLLPPGTYQAVASYFNGARKVTRTALVNLLR